MEPFTLPLGLEPFRKSIEESKTDFVKISIEEAGNLTLKQSKFGGYPFLPVGIDYPHSLIDHEEKIYAPMILLAQINFKDLPENSFFPKKGILQIYIGDDDFHGCGISISDSSDTICKNLILQQGFKILYFADENSEHQQNFDFLTDLEREFSPLGFENKQYALEFQIKQEYVPTTDIRFKNFLKKAPFDFFSQFGEEKDKIWNEYSKKINSAGHKMGGYGFVLQEDPRAYCETFKDYVLLLQIDSEGEIEWGDSGSAQFFISKEALKNLDFSNVVYYWACF